MAFKKTKKKDSFAQWFMDSFGEEKFKKLINHERNINEGLDIWTLSKNSVAKLWFYCENKDYHEFCMSASNYYIGNRCRYCARTKYVHPRDSLGQYLTDNYGVGFLNTIWSDKNKKSPFKYSLGTEVKVWFNCPCGVHEPKLRQVKNTVRSNFNCPYCTEENNSSILQKKVFTYIQSLGYKINTECNCSIVPTNPKTKHKMPFDNEIEDLKLIIEVHGSQHYKEVGVNSKWLNNTTSKEYLYKRKLYDRYKRIVAKGSGYFYLEIPYWCDDDKESWKELINDKINNIKREQRLRRMDYISDVDATV